MPRKSAPLAALAVLLAGCTNATPPLMGILSAAGGVALKPAQTAAVEDGVRRMVPNPETAKFSAPVARMGKEDATVDVCGHVGYLDPATAKTVEQPYYVELRETNGRPAAERGQVGGDPAKLAKVRFMCRKHGL
jgi:hypothetical protein